MACKKSSFFGIIRLERSKRRKFYADLKRKKKDFFFEGTYLTTVNLHFVSMHSIGSGDLVEH